MALRYNERTGEFEDTNGGSRRPRRRPAVSSAGSSGSTIDSLAEKIGQGFGYLITIGLIVKLAGCIFG